MLESDEIVSDMEESEYGSLLIELASKAVSASTSTDVDDVRSQVAAQRTSDDDGDDE